MAIENDNQLMAAVNDAGRFVQDIQDYCGRSLREDAKIRFPRGMAGTAEEYRQQCPKYLTPNERSSCAYGFMYLDVLWWVAGRTDIAGILREMVLKSAIITTGTILESVLRIPGEGILSPVSNAGVKSRVQRAQDRGWINAKDAETLKLLWTHRNNVHLHLLDTKEFDKYKSEHVNEPRVALGRLMESLAQWDKERRK